MLSLVVLRLQLLGQRPVNHSRRGSGVSYVDLGCLALFFGENNHCVLLLRKQQSSYEFLAGLLLDVHQDLAFLISMGDQNVQETVCQLF